MTYSELNEMTISDLQNLNSMVVQTINNKDQMIVQMSEELSHYKKLHVQGCDTNRSDHGYKRDKKHTHKEKEKEMKKEYHNKNPDPTVLPILKNNFTGG